MQPLSGTDLVAPRFGIDNVNTNLARINYANALVYWWYRADQGSRPDPSVAGATGTRIDYQAIEQLIETPEDSILAIDALNELLVDGRMSAHEKQIIATAMQQWTPEEDLWLRRGDLNSNWRREQVRTALYLILSSPNYQVQR